MMGLAGSGTFVQHRNPLRSDTSPDQTSGWSDLLDQLPFREIWAVDFEFIATHGERPLPVCLVARELRSGRLLRFWQDDLSTMRAPPYPMDASTLFVAYYASAELTCHLALGWPIPERIIDLYAEFRVATNGRRTVGGNGLLGALIAHGLDSLGADQKRDMRDLILRGGPWSAEERTAILDYCQSDVDALARLLLAMLPALLRRNVASSFALGQALLRGRSMAAAARMEDRGVPIDTASLTRLRRHWADIQDHLVASIDRDYNAYDGRSFKRARFAAFLAETRIFLSSLPRSIIVSTFGGSSTDLLGGTATG